MTSTATRRPLPALLLLLALTLLTGLVWWRVLNRGDSGGSPVTAAPVSTPCPTPSTGLTVLPARATITVQVLNSTQRSGIATAAQAALQQDGFQTPTAASNDTGHPQLSSVAEIRYSGAAHLPAATLVSYYFPGSTLTPVTTALPTTVVVSLGVAYHSVATASQVQAALTAAHKTVAANPPAASGATASATASATTGRSSSAARSSGSASC